MSKANRRRTFRPSPEDDRRAVLTLVARRFDVVPSEEIYNAVAKAGVIPLESMAKMVAEALEDVTGIAAGTKGVLTGADYAHLANLARQAHYSHENQADLAAEKD